MPGGGITLRCDAWRSKEMWRAHKETARLSAARNTGAGVRRPWMSRHRERLSASTIIVVERETQQGKRITAKRRHHKKIWRTTCCRRGDLLPRWMAEQATLESVKATTRLGGKGPREIKSHRMAVASRTALDSRRTSSGRSDTNPGPGANENSSSRNRRRPPPHATSLASEATKAIEAMSKWDVLMLMLLIITATVSALIGARSRAKLTRSQNRRSAAARLFQRTSPDQKADKQDAAERGLWGVVVMRSRVLSAVVRSATCAGVCLVKELRVVCALWRARVTRKCWTRQVAVGCEFPP